MDCLKCGKEIPDGSVFCNWCGKKQTVTERKPRKRGNGQGSVYKTPNGKYKAIVTLGYYLDDKGTPRRKTHSATFEKMKDAVAALPRLQNEPIAEPKKKQQITFKELYDKWLPTHRASKPTIACYKAAMKHFYPVWYYPMSEIDVDDLQECIDSCGKGKRTQQNMRTTCGLIYKYGIPRNAVPNNLNLSAYLVVSGEGSVHRESFSDIEIEKIKDSIGKVDFAEYIYVMIYLGFRPSEALNLTVNQYSRENKCFVGGGKTEAGCNRTVTVSPKIQEYVDKIIGERTEGFVFCDKNGEQFKLKSFTENCFYYVLESVGIDNPIVEVAGGVKRHKYTPHSCRHTFSTLMKKIDAPTKDKLRLIGHASEEMLLYYQDVNIDDLRKITDSL